MHNHMAIWHIYLIKNGARVHFPRKTDLATMKDLPMFLSASWPSPPAATAAARAEVGAERGRRCGDFRSSTTCLAGLLPFAGRLARLARRRVPRGASGRLLEVLRQRRMERELCDSVLGFGVFRGFRRVWWRFWGHFGTCKINLEGAGLRDGFRDEVFMDFSAFGPKACQLVTLPTAENRDTLGNLEWILGFLGIPPHRGRLSQVCCTWTKRSLCCPGIPR